MNVSQVFSWQAVLPPSFRALSVRDLKIIYQQFEFNRPDWPEDAPIAGCAPCLGVMCLGRGDRETDCIMLRQSSLRGGRLTCQRSNQCQVGSEASWAAAASSLCSSTQLLSLIRSLCKGRHSGPGVGGGVQAVLIERSVLVWKFEGSARAWGHMVHATHAESLTCRSAVSHL